MTSLGRRLSRAGEAFGIKVNAITPFGFSRMVWTAPEYGRHSPANCRSAPDYGHQEFARLAGPCELLSAYAFTESARLPREGMLPSAADTPRPYG